MPENFSEWISLKIDHSVLVGAFEFEIEYLEIVSYRLRSSY
jgi:hypothetical protein